MRTLAIAAAPLLALALLAGSAGAAVRTQTVEYRQGDTVLRGHLAWDDALAGPRPGVLVVHEWYGLNDFARQRAEELARLGYVALAADMYGGGRVAADAKEAASLSGALKQDRPLLRARAAATLAALQERPEVDRRRTAAIGYCFGGTTVLELARAGADLAGAVSFHGNLDTPLPATAGAIKARLLVLHGAADPYVPPAQVEAFGQEMDAAGADWQMVSYGHAVHSFTNPAAGDDPARGAAYDARAAARSWATMLAFFGEVLAAGP